MRNIFIYIIKSYCKYDIITFSKERVFSKENFVHIMANVEFGSTYYVFTNVNYDDSSLFGSVGYFKFKLDSEGAIDFIMIDEMLFNYYIYILRLVEHEELNGFHYNSIDVMVVKTNSFFKRSMFYILTLYI